MSLTPSLKRALGYIADGERVNDPCYVVSATMPTMPGEINVRTARALWRRGLIVWDNSSDDGTYLTLTAAGAAGQEGTSRG